MGVKFNIKRKIKVNGREYSSVEEMPEDIRRIYDKAVCHSAESEQSTEMTRLETKIVFNGQEFKSVDDIPPEARQIYKSAMAVAGPPGNTAGHDQHSGLGGLSPKQVYRRIWIFFGGGAILFALIVALGSILQANRAAGNLTWALVLPLALIACAVYTSIRYWRCPKCGAYLPTTSTGLRKRQCQKCGRPFEL